MGRTGLLHVAAISIAMLAIGCGAHPEPVLPLSKRIDTALEKGVRFIVSRQDADGLWRSDVYGSFKDPSALTPLVSSALEATKTTSGADERAANFLAGLIQPNGATASETHGLGYPLYTAAFTIHLLNRPNRLANEKSRAAWAADLASRQLDEKLGWEPADSEYGGWGYAKELPRKPAAGLRVLPGTESNLSATTFALEALSQVKIEKDVLRKARILVERCQNHSGEASSYSSSFDDGGFFFIPTDALRNKAGVAGKDASGRDRYASYGSATADGIRALRACGVSESDPRLKAACQWLDRNFRPESHPGGYTADREVNREALYYYYAYSVSRALRYDGDDLDRREKLAEALIARQDADGAWVNPVVAVREDDPLVATSFAMLALAACRDERKNAR
jgi:squalene-hopene/tetraprenyl-beta-curcumene cyclase